MLFISWNSCILKMGPTSTIHAVYPLLSWFAVERYFHTHQTKHFSITWLKFDFNTPVCFVTCSGWSFLSSTRSSFFFSLIFSLDFLSPTLVFQECQLKLLFSFFFFGFPFAFEVQLWGVASPIQGKNAMLDLWSLDPLFLWLICCLNKNRVMGSCILPNSYKMAAIWIAWLEAVLGCPSGWWISKKVPSACALCTIIDVFIALQMPAKKKKKKCNITWRGVLIFLKNIVSPSYYNVFCDKTVIIFLVHLH